MSGVVVAERRAWITLALAALAVPAALALLGWPSGTGPVVLVAGAAALGAWLVLAWAHARRPRGSASIPRRTSRSTIHSWPTS